MTGKSVFALRCNYYLIVNSITCLCALIFAGLLTLVTFELRHEKTGLRDFRPGPTQTDLYSHRSRLEA